MVMRELIEQVRPQAWLLKGFHDVSTTGAKSPTIWPHLKTAAYWP